MTPARAEARRLGISGADIRIAEAALVVAAVYFLIVGVGIIVGIFVFTRFRDESHA